MIYSDDQRKDVAAVDADRPDHVDMIPRSLLFQPVNLHCNYKKTDFRFT